ncbi:MAG TPA: hypothetical protein VF542_09140, partial [Jatrophihabitans sp.]
MQAIKRVLAVTAAATLTGVAALLATAAPASAINPCDAGDPPAYCYDDYDPAPPTPAAPTNLSAPSVLQTSVTLQWTDNASNETGYQIRRVVSGTTTSYFSAAANSTSFTDTTAPAARYIEYYVSAKNCTSTCSASSAPRVAVQTHQQPANPTGGLSTSSALGYWGYYSITGWTIDYDTTGPLQVSLVLDGVVTSTKTADAAYSGLNASNPGYGDNHGYNFYTVKSTAKGNHTVCVRATNVGGGSDFDLYCGSYSVAGPPSAATNLTLTNTGTSMVIGFTDNANDETGYVLQR